MAETLQEEARRAAASLTGEGSNKPFRDEAIAGLLNKLADALDRATVIDDAAVERAAKAIMRERNEGNPRFDLDEWIEADAVIRHGGEARAALEAAFRKE